MGSAVLVLCTLVLRFFLQKHNIKMPKRHGPIFPQWLRSGHGICAVLVFWFGKENKNAKTVLNVCSIQGI